MDSRKKEIDVEFTQQYTLSPEAFKQLIADKIKRNSVYGKADNDERERLALGLA